IPVPPAPQNLQGMGYATGIFQKYPKLNTVAFVFVQPKLHRVTRVSYGRAGLPAMMERIRDVIQRAKSATKVLKPGPYCDFCAHAGTCSAVIQDAAKAVAVYDGLPMERFTGFQLTTPEDVGRAVYILNRLEAMLKDERVKELKSRA